MPSKQYHITEEGAIFKASGGDIVFTPQNLSNESGRISEVWDRGAGSLPGLYKYYAKTVAAASLTVKYPVRIYLVQSYGIGAGEVTGNFGTSDAAVASESRLANLGGPIGAIIADSTTNGAPQIGTGLCFLYARYIQVVWWNSFGQALTNVDEHVFTLDSYVPEQQ